MLGTDLMFTKNYCEEKRVMDEMFVQGIVHRTLKTSPTKLYNDGWFYVILVSMDMLNI